jgi:hypothetical protein
MRLDALRWVSSLLLLCEAITGCKLPYRTLTQVLVVPYGNLIAEPSATDTSCLRAPATDLAVPPEAAQLQVKAANLRLAIKNEGPTPLLVSPHLASRGTDPYSLPALGAGEQIALPGRGAQVERSYPLAAEMFKAEAWTIGLRATSPIPWPADSLNTGNHLEVRWQIDVDASLL